MIRLPKGFRAGGVAAGLKKSGDRDMALIFSDTPCAMAGTFTTNQVKAATVKLDMARLKSRTPGHGVIINSGNANCCNGPQGMKDAERMAALTAELLGVSPQTCYVCSTGRIGVNLPMDIIEPGIRKIVGAIRADGGEEAARAIMTTDTRPKFGTVRLKIGDRPVILSGMAKGAGMIEPHMATMLCFLLTDARVKPGALQRALSDAVADSFNRITVDGDMSTNDTVLFFANGQAGNAELGPGHKDWPAFAAAVRALCLNLALKMVHDGEGADKFVTIRVKGARNAADADVAARSVANSMLVKTSWAGGYPNWGRIMDALGYSPARVIENKVEMFYDGRLAVRQGVKAGVSIDQMKRIQAQKDFTITIDLHLGQGEAVIYTCNCTEEYVRINM